jgi:hypothetical protein
VTCGSAVIFGPGIPYIVRRQLMPFALVIELPKWRPASTGARRDRSVRHRNGTGNREQDVDQYRGADQDRRVPRRPMCTAAGPRRGTTRMVADIFALLAEYERELIHERAAVARQAARAQGKQTGRPHALTPDQVRIARRMREGGSQCLSSAPHGTPGCRAQSPWATRRPSASCTYRSASMAWLAASSVGLGK